MSLIKPDFKNLSPFSAFDDNFDNFFQGFFRPVVSSAESLGKLPAVDVKEDKNNYVLSAELPGYDREDIDLQLKDGVLTIRAEHKEENKREEKNHILSERHYGSYFRQLRFGHNVAESDVTANYDKGILTVQLPKLQPNESSHKKIDIQ